MRETDGKTVQMLDPQHKRRKDYIIADEALRCYYPTAAVERLHLAPADLGVESIGHFGFFRKSMPRGAWDDIAGWFEGRLLAARHSGGASVAAE